jgi:DNA-binding GntR family transcriptional regulator
LSGRVEPGTLITLRSLAASLGTSMMPVREAIGRLSAEQAVEILPNRGIRIPVLSAKDWDEVWSLRGMLEGEAVGHAARAATSDDILTIQSRFERVLEAAAEADIHATLAANSEFQFAIFKAARSRVLIRFVETLRMQTIPHCVTALRQALASNDDYFARTLDNDSNMVRAIAAGDARLASRTKQQDIQELREYVEGTAPQGVE